MLSALYPSHPAKFHLSSLPPSLSPSLCTAVYTPPSRLPGTALLPCSTGVGASPPPLVTQEAKVLDEYRYGRHR